MVYEFTPINLQGEDAFKEVFTTFYPLLVMYTRRYLSQDDLIEDIVQESFVELWEIRFDFLSLEQAQSFLYACVRNRALNVIKHNKVVQKHQSQQEENPSPSLESDFFIESETYRILLDAVDTLPLRMRQVIHAYLKGMSPSTIAEELDISVETVYSQKQLAYSRLRSKLAKHFYLILFLLQILT